ncbi:hypothetical protein FACS1894170_07040 [Planctomycetales bacterium]|nr:hypothetical protein FACS1894170_07040 [Planctomycetales bacterium]
MPDPLQHVQTGDPIRADMLNAVIDGARIARNSLKTGGGAIDGFHSTNTTLRVSNATGGDLKRFSIVALAEPIYFSTEATSSFFTEPAFRGTVPTEWTNGFAILQKPALPNQIVPACVTGVSVAKLTVINESDEFASPGNSTETLLTGPQGLARILWKESGSGERWGLVQFPVGGAEKEVLYGVVMSPVHCPPNSALDPTNQGFYNSMGRVKIENKQYPAGTPYDLCACRELAGSEEEYPEQLIRGLQVKLVLGGTVINADDTATPWYLAVETEGTYQGLIDRELTGSNGYAEITIKDSNNIPVVLSVRSTALLTDQTIPENVGVIASRISDRLVIIKAPCPE